MTAARNLGALCRRCRHWKPIGAALNSGECRRYPPALDGRRPATRPDQTCGEFSDTDPA